MKYLWAGILLAFAAFGGAMGDHYTYKYWANHTQVPTVVVTVIRMIPIKDTLHPDVVGSIFFYPGNRNAEYASADTIIKNRSMYGELAAMATYDNTLRVECPDTSQLDVDAN
jgi:hypothetical protein